MERVACAYQGKNDNLIIILYVQDVPFFGADIPTKDITTFRKDIENIKHNHLPMCAAVIPPTSAYLWSLSHEAYATLYDDDTVKGFGAGEEYYNG